jgi:hypothetical protein
VGQFRSAGGLVLLSGRSWGLRFPAAHIIKPARSFQAAFLSATAMGVYSSLRRGSPARELNCCEVNVPL